MKGASPLHLHRAQEAGNKEIYSFRSILSQNNNGELRASPGLSLTVASDHFVL